MTIKLRVIADYILILALVFVLSGFEGFATQAAGVPQRVIVTLEDPVNEDARTALNGLGGKILKELPLVNSLVVLLPSEAAVSDVGALAGVKRVEADAKVFTLKPPGGCTPWPDCNNGGGDGGSTQPAEVLEWGVDRIDADLTWAVSRGVGVKVAIIDTGIDKDHADLVDNLKGGVN